MTPPLTLLAAKRTAAAAIPPWSTTHGKKFGTAQTKIAHTPQKKKPPLKKVRNNPMIATLIFLFVVLPVLMAIGAVLSVLQNANARHAAQNLRDQLTAARIAESNEKRALAAAIKEQRIAQEHNKTALHDIRVEKEELNRKLAELKVLEMQQKLGLTAAEFNPADYSSDRDPFTPQ
jgi:hypothetical protein